MRVLVAGATSVPGLPLLRELTARGHDVVGLTRQAAKTPQIEQAGAKPVVADVFDAEQIASAVADIEPRSGGQPADHAAEAGAHAGQGL